MVGAPQPTSHIRGQLVYDAPNDSKRNRMVEGDAGKELRKANKGAGGTYRVEFDGKGHPCP